MSSNKFVTENHLEAIRNAQKGVYRPRERPKPEAPTRNYRDIDWNTPQMQRALAAKKRGIFQRNPLKEIVTSKDLIRELQEAIRESRNPPAYAGVFSVQKKFLPDPVFEAVYRTKQPIEEDFFIEAARQIPEESLIGYGDKSVDAKELEPDEFSAIRALREIGGKLRLGNIVRDVKSDLERLSQIPERRSRQIPGIDSAQQGLGDLTYRGFYEMIHVLAFGEERGDEYIPQVNDLNWLYKYTEMLNTAGIISRPIMMFESPVPDSKNTNLIVVQTSPNNNKTQSELDSYLDFHRSIVYSISRGTIIPEQAVDYIQRNGVFNAEFFILGKKCFSESQLDRLTQKFNYRDSLDQERLERVFQAEQKELKEYLTRKREIDQEELKRRSEQYREAEKDLQQQEYDLPTDRISTNIFIPSK